MRTNHQYFSLIVALLCLGYFLFELFLNQHNMLLIDELWFAHLAYQYKSGLPYRDFAPYKTVLGYYFLLLPLLIGQGVLKTLYLTKHFLALLNTCILFVGSYWLTRFFSRSAILISLSLLLASEIFLSYSTNIRVDLIGYWFALFSILFILEKRFLLAGFFLSLGFITTQKIIWYYAALNIALLLQFLIFLRTRVALKRIFYFNFCFLSVILAYIIFWSYLSNFATVMHSIFEEASILYKLDWYAPSRKIFWTHTLLHNPLLFALWPLTLISLFVTSAKDKEYQNRFLIVIAAFVIFLCLIPYKMIFPYYMQVTSPIFLLLYTAFFSWLSTIIGSSENKLIVPSYILWLITLSTVGLIIFIMIDFELPLAYLLSAFIPLLLILYLTSSLDASIFRKFIFFIILFMGFIYPSIKFYIKSVAADGAYQKAHMNVITKLLGNNNEYVAGVEFIYNKTQPIPGLRQLVGPSLDYLNAPSAKLRPFMLPSLYLDPNITSHDIIQSLKQNPIRFYINTFRMAALPQNIRDYLDSQYQHLWGSIYIYAPEVKSGLQKVAIAFTGHYQIESKSKVEINHHHYKNHLVYLKKGIHLSSATHEYRLKLLPDHLDHDLNVRFQKEEVKKIIW